jgi:hypothetical protein
MAEGMVRLAAEEFGSAAAKRDEHVFRKTWINTHQDVRLCLYLFYVRERKDGILYHLSKGGSVAEI